MIYFSLVSSCFIRCGTHGAGVVLFCYRKQRSNTRITVPFQFSLQLSPASVSSWLYQVTDIAHSHRPQLLLDHRLPLSQQLASESCCSCHHRRKRVLSRLFVLPPLHLLHAYLFLRCSPLQLNYEPDNRGSTLLADRSFLLQMLFKYWVITY